MLRQRRPAEPLLPQYRNDDTTPQTAREGGEDGRRRRKRRRGPRRRRGRLVSPPAVAACLLVVVGVGLVVVLLSSFGGGGGDDGDTTGKWWSGHLALHRVVRRRPPPRYETVTCRDGVTVGYRNDDYCDCLEDGADETETSACAGLTMNLVGVGHFACHDGRRMVYASRVHDGVRDCADGSDER